MILLWKAQQVYAVLTKKTDIQERERERERDPVCTGAYFMNTLSDTFMTQDYSLPKTLSPSKLLDLFSLFS